MRNELDFGLEQNNLKILVENQQFDVEGTQND